MATNDPPTTKSDEQIQQVTLKYCDGFAPGYAG